MHRTVDTLDEEELETVHRVILRMRMNSRSTGSIR